MAQDARDSLRRGIQAYDFAEYTAALPLLAAGLNPAAGPRDSLWTAGLHRLAHALIEGRKDSLATVWLRWAVRLKPDIPVDTIDFPPTVGDGFALARAFVSTAGRADTVAETLWDWGGARSPGDAAFGALRVERTGVPVSVFIEGVGPLAPGEPRRLPPASYTILASAQGYFRAQVIREVLPGVTTVLRFRPRALAAGELAFLYVASAPWGAVYLDGERIGYTAIAARPIAAGSHRVRIERLGYAPFDTTITVARDQRLRLGTIRLKPAGGRQ